MSSPTAYGEQRNHEGPERECIGNECSFPFLRQMVLKDNLVQKRSYFCKTQINR